MRRFIVHELLDTLRRMPQLMCLRGEITVAPKAHAACAQAIYLRASLRSRTLQPSI